MAILMGDKEGEEEEIPLIVQDMLKSFEDVMPDQLPQRIPPRREVDHQNELLPGVMLLAKGPLLLALPKLAKLRKQLNELLDARFI